MAYYGPDSKLNKAFYLKVSLEFLLTDIFLFRLVLKQEVNLSLSNGTYQSFYLSKHTMYLSKWEKNGKMEQPQIKGVCISAYLHWLWLFPHCG